MQPVVKRNEASRVKSAKALGLFDHVEHPTYNAIVQMTRLAADAPICLFSIVGERKQFFKAKVGVDIDETPREHAFCAWAIAQDDLDTIFTVENAEQDVRFRDNPLVTGKAEIRFYAGAPVLDENNLPVGTVCVIDHKPRELTPEMREALELAKALLQQAIARSIDPAKDRLTTLYSKQYFDHEMERECRRACRDHTEIAVVLFDIDHFRSYVQLYGQLAGERALQQVAAAVQGCAQRLTDTVARYADDEIVMVLPATDKPGATLLAARAREAVAALDIEHEQGNGGYLTVSAGVGAAGPTQAVETFAENVLGLANQALFTSKVMGRNRVTVCGTDDFSSDAIAVGMTQGA